MSYIGRDIRTGAFRQLDDISSGFDGSDTTHTMQVNSTNVSVGDVNQILLSLGGVIQKPGTDFTVSGSTLTFTTAPAANTSFFAILLGSDNGGTVTPTDGSVTGDKIASDLSIATNVTITTADNTDTLTLTSTDADANAGPNLRFYRNSSSPADDDVIGRVDFEGRNNNSEDIIYANIQGEIMQEADGSEDGQLQFGVMKAGTLRNAFTIDRVATVFNEDSQDIDFRVESNDKTNMFFVDGGNNRIGINTTGQVNHMVNIEDVTGNGGGTLGLSVSSSGTSDNLGRLHFGNATDPVLAAIFGIADGASDAGALTFRTEKTGAALEERMRIASTGNVAIGNTDTTPAFGVTVADTRVTSGVCLDVHHTKSDTTFSGMVARFQSARNTTNETYEFIRAGISGIANKFVVHDSGDVDNATGVFGQISDERIKQNITDANSQWDDIKALKFKNFRKKANVRDFGDDALTELGVIAQDLEAAGMNGLVKESQPDPSHVYSDSSFGTVWTEDDDEVKNGTETLGEIKEVKAKVKIVKYSILYMKAVKALQEAQTRIETLEADVKTLKGE